METRKRITAAIAIVLAVIICKSADAQTVATLADVQGAVHVKSGPTGEWEPASDGDTVSAGDSIRTGASGQAVIRWDGGNALKVFPLSQMRISELAIQGNSSRAGLDLQNGRLLAKAAKLRTHDSAFEIKTPTAIAAVRGTAFDVSMSQQTKNTTFAVVDGSIYVSAGDEVIIVSEGFESVVESAGSPSKPQPIPPAQLKKLRDEAAGIGVKTGDAGSDKKEEKAAAKEEEPAEEPAEETVDAGEVSEEIVTDNLDDIYDETIQDAIVDEAHSDVLDPGCGGVSGVIQF